VLLWFAGLGVAGVWLVFRSPAVDHRLVALGAVLPVGEVVLGGPKLLHTLLGAVTALVVVMALTRSRLRRRQLLGLPIGLFLHLVLDGVWSHTELFWWPLFGFDVGTDQLPELDRGLALTLVMELVGAIALVVVWRYFGLVDAGRRRRFLRSGRLDPRPAR
jgi:hypothetical protein